MTTETSGRPWGDKEKAQWRSEQIPSRSYRRDVLDVVDTMRADFDVIEYGTLNYDPDTYPLFALRNRNWRNDRPCALVTGGVHGYETSGVLGALQFVRDHGLSTATHLNLVVAPCVSPWAYERNHRWNPDAIDPNRSFHPSSPAGEAASLMTFMADIGNDVLVHVDLHETTDTDETIFRPTQAARDGRAIEPGAIPDGFYLCGDSLNPQLEFQAAVLRAVAEITHIAPPDSNGEIIESTMVAPGVILYDYHQFGLCAGMTNARFTTTTEVYPDSARATPQQCNDAQVAAVRAAIEFAVDSLR
jgi:hypothetical protein